MEFRVVTLTLEVGYHPLIRKAACEQLVEAVRAVSCVPS